LSAVVLGQHGVDLQNSSVHFYTFQNTTSPVGGAGMRRFRLVPHVCVRGAYARVACYGWLLRMGGWRGCSYGVSVTGESPGVMLIVCLPGARKVDSLVTLALRLGQ
jgi:hypothetical protein